MKEKSLWITILVLLLFLVPVTAADNGKIAFNSDRDGNTEIYVMNADGFGVTRITDNPATDDSADWSPDGLKLAFVSNRDFLPDDPLRTNIYVMNEDGTGQSRITDEAGKNIIPRWSPDGTKIMFTSDRGGSYQIYIMNPDGSGVVQLTDTDDDNFGSSWSPDGSKIAFESYRDGGEEIYIMNADGSDPVRITDNPAQDTDAQWSPDGKKIAFGSNREDNGVYPGDELYVMNTDGSSVTRLTYDPAGDYIARWSPDSKKIAFSSYRDVVFGEPHVLDIYVMDADTGDVSGVTRLTDNTEYQDIATSWWGPAPPTVVNGAMDQPNPQFILPIHTLTFHATFSDPDWLDTHTASWSFGDGSGSAGILSEEHDPPIGTGTVTATHAYSSSGDYLVSVTVTDEDGEAATSEEWTVHVADVEEATNDLAAYIQGLPSDAFRGNDVQRKAAFANMFHAMDNKIENGAWNGYITSLQSNVREKADGHVDGKSQNDWIVDTTAQEHICMKIDDIVAYVETFME